MEIEHLIKEVINCANIVRRILTPGYLESVYKNALILELKNIGITDIQTEVPLNVLYKGTIIGDFRADIVVENKLIIELKAISSLTTVHEIQLVNYLTTTGYDYGLLINFGSPKIEIKRKYREYKPYVG